MTSKSGQHECPRCGYDLSGIVDSWTTECPVEGICSECGLKYGWRSILNDAFRRDESFFENSSRRYVRAFTKTLFLALLAWRFWRWVKLEYEFRLLRCLTVSITGFVVCGAVAVAGVVILLQQLQSRMNAKTNWYYFGDAMRWARWPLGIPESYPTWMSVLSPMAIAAILLSAGVPVSYLLLPQTLRAAKVRRHHLARIWLYSLVGEAVCLASRSIALGAISLFVYACIYTKSIIIRSDPIEWFLYENSCCFCEVVLSFCWSLCWWGFAGSRYLKINHPWIVSTILSVLSLIAALTVVFAAAAWRTPLAQF